jgi:hypothetical protein
VLGFNVVGITKTATGGTGALVIFTEMSRSLTFVWNFGMYLILLAFLRRLYLSLDNFQLAARRFYSWWGNIVCLLLIAAPVLSGVAENPTGDSVMSLVALRLARSANYLLQAIVVLEAIAILILGAGFILVVMKRRPGGKCPNPPAFMTSLVALVAVPLLAVRNVSDQLRIWTHHRPSIPELIGAGLAPEAIIIAGWLALGFRIWLWEKTEKEGALSIKSNAKFRWRHAIEEAYCMVCPLVGEPTEAYLHRIEIIDSGSKSSTLVSIMAGGMVTWLKMGLAIGTGPERTSKGNLIGHDGRLQYQELVAYLDRHRRDIEHEADIVADNIVIIIGDKASIDLKQTVAQVQQRIYTEQGPGPGDAGDRARLLCRVFLSDLDASILLQDV